MSDRDRYAATADQMLRFATGAMNEDERRSYLDLAAEWRRLAREAAALDERRAAAADPPSCPTQEETLPKLPDESREA
jgi:hypothetical protein